MKTGFTLVELIIVLVFIGILLVLIPVFFKVLMLAWSWGMS